MLKEAENRSVARRMALLKCATAGNAALGALAGAAVGAGYNALTEDRRNTRAYLRRALLGAVAGGLFGSTRSSKPMSGFDALSGFGITDESML